jgi:hypothetical protein
VFSAKQRAANTRNVHAGTIATIAPAPSRQQIPLEYHARPGRTSAGPDRRAGLAGPTADCRLAGFSPGRFNNVAPSVGLDSAGSRSIGRMSYGYKMGLSLMTAEEAATELAEPSDNIEYGNV